MSPVMRPLVVPGMLLAALAALAACGGSKPKAAAGSAPASAGKAAAPASQGPAADAIRSFHARLDDADFAAIWSDSDATFRSSVPRADYERYMARLHSRLGHVVNTANIRAMPLQVADRPTLLLAQNTTFEHGAGLETFTFLITPRGPVLIGYNLQSAALGGS